MKIVFLIYSNGMGGAEKRYLNLFNYLVKNSAHDYTFILNHELYHLYQRCGYSFENKKRMVKIGTGLFFRKNIFYPTRFNRLKAGIILFSRLINRQLKNIYQKYDFDITYAILGGVRFLHIPCVRKTHRVAAYVDPTFDFIEKSRRIRANINDAQALDILHESLKTELIKRGINRSENMYVADFSFVNYSKTAIEKKEPIIAFSTRLTPGKGIRELLATIEVSLQRLPPSAKFIIMGTGKLQREVNNFAKKIGSRQVNYLGFVENPINILSKSLIFLSLQHLNNYPSQSLLEAMACGNAIIASDVGETYKLVDEEVGFRVPLDPQKISEKIIWLLNHREEAIKMGLAARKRVMTEHTVERYKEHVGKIYKNLIGQQ